MSSGRTAGRQGHDDATVDDLLPGRVELWPVRVVEAAAVGDVDATFGQAKDVYARLRG